MSRWIARVDRLLAVLAGLALVLFIAFYAVRLVWVSHAMHHVSQGADATPLWMPRIAMTLFTQRPVGDSMLLTIWGSTSSWTLIALPLFLWMGEILFRTKPSEDMFRGLSPWLNRLPGRLLHTNVIGCAIFAAVSGSSAATCATIGKITLPELERRGYPREMAVGTLAGAGTLGLLIPPSIIMIVYGVAANVSIAKLFIAGVLPGIALALVFMGFIGLPRHLAEFIGGLGLSPFAMMVMLLLLVAFYVVLSCFLDCISMVVLTVAVLLPTVQKAGYDMIWFGIFIVLVVELAQITPPVGFNLFVLQGLTRRDITWIAKVSMPLFWLMLAFVLLLWFVPGLATWMPSRM